MLATKSNSYTFQKDGIWYFSRRVPADLRRHYRTGRIAYSLRTKSVRDARVRAMSDAAKLDRHWHILRISSDDLPGKHLLNDAVQESAAVSSIDDHSFKAAVRRSCGYLIDCCGMKDLHDYVRSDATKFRDYLFAKGLNGASVARIFGTVRAVINLALSEFGLAIVNPFSNVYFDHNVGVKKHHPVNPDDIKKVQEECYKADDEKRWLISLIADTGMRLAEGTTLDEMLWPEGKEPKAAWAVAEKLGLAVEQELSLSTGPFAWPDIGNITSDTARFAETLLEAYEEHGVVKR